MEKFSLLWNMSTSFPRQYISINISHEDLFVYSIFSFYFGFFIFHSHFSFSIKIENNHILSSYWNLMEKSNYPSQSILIFIDDISITASEGIGNWWKEDTFPLSAYDLALIPSNEDDGTDFPQIPAVYWLAHCVKTAITKMNCWFFGYGSRGDHNRDGNYRLQTLNTQQPSASVTSKMALGVSQAPQLSNVLQPWYRFVLWFSPIQLIYR